MIKFIHKKHADLNPKTDKFVIYYSVLDIVLGFLLMVLVAFFIYNYLSVSFHWTKSTTFYPPAFYSQMMRIPTK